MHQYNIVQLEIFVEFYFQKIFETSGVFQKIFMKWCFKNFQACSKEGEG